MSMQHLMLIPEDDAMSERNLVTTIHLPVVQVPQSRSYGTENGGQPVSSQFARYTDDLPVESSQNAPAAPHDDNISLFPLAPLLPVAQFAIEPKQEDDPPERKRRSGFLRSSCSTSRTPVRHACIGSKEPLRGLQNSFQKMGLASKKKLGNRASERRDEDETRDGEKNKPRTGSDTISTTDDYIWWIPSDGQTAANSLDSGVAGTAQRIRCEECRLNRIITCIHPYPHPERRAPIPQTWQDDDWEEQRRLREELEAWTAAQRALNVPERGAAERPPQVVGSSVMARGRPRIEERDKRS